MLEVRNVTKRFGGLVAVDDVTLTVERNEILGLIGPNGAGKTTLFNMIAGVFPARNAPTKPATSASPGPFRYPRYLDP